MRFAVKTLSATMGTLTMGPFVDERVIFGAGRAHSNRSLHVAVRVFCRFRVEGDRIAGIEPRR